MGMLLAFAPFILFAMVQRFLGSTVGLLVAAGLAAVLLLRTWMSGRTVKVLEIGTVVLFAGSAAYALATNSKWSIADVRFRVDAGLLLVVVASIAIRKPFTLQYAREAAPPEVWSNQAFIRLNYAITAVWALAFAVMAGTDLVFLYWPNLPVIAGVGATILAMLGAIGFTSWYPARVRARLRQTQLSRSGAAAGKERP
jgi:hypothetical protein